MSLTLSTNPQPRKRFKAAGATLIELVVCLAIMGIITTGMYSFFLATNQTYGDQAVLGRMLWTANDAMSRIAQDIRNAGTLFPPTHPCFSLLPALVTTTGTSPGSIMIRVILDDPALRTELATDQLQTNTAIAVFSSAGFQVNDVAFISDGVRCTQFTVSGVIGGTPSGLQHVPANDTNSAGGAGYNYPAATSMVYKRSVNQQVVYAIDTSDPTTPWLTRDAGAGPVRLVPDVQDLTLSGLTAGSVTISLTAKTDTRSRLLGGDGFRRRTLTSSVKFRNT